MESFAGDPTLARLLEGTNTQLAAAFVSNLFDLGLRDKDSPVGTRFLRVLLDQISTRLDHPTAYPPRRRYPGPVDLGRADAPRVRSRCPRLPALWRPAAGHRHCAGSPRRAGPPRPPGPLGRPRAARPRPTRARRTHVARGSVPLSTLPLTLAGGASPPPAPHPSARFLTASSWRRRMARVQGRSRCRRSPSRPRGRRAGDSPIPQGPGLGSSGGGGPSAPRRMAFVPAMRFDNSDRSKVNDAGHAWRARAGG